MTEPQFLGLLPSLVESSVRFSWPLLPSDGFFASLASLDLLEASAKQVSIY